MNHLKLKLYLWEKKQGVSRFINFLACLFSWEAQALLPAQFHCAQAHFSFLIISLEGLIIIVEIILKKIKEILDNKKMVKTLEGRGEKPYFPGAYIATQSVYEGMISTMAIRQ